MTHSTLVTVLENINAARVQGTPDLALLKEYAKDKTIMKHLLRAETRLAVYGSLAPGEVNHREIESLTGSWVAAKVKGVLAPQGWGQHVGFPGITWDETAPSVDIQLFTSPDLPAHWSTLDSFEGRDYRRILVPVQTDKEMLVANIYQLVKQST